MAKLKILEVPHPVLREKATPVDASTIDDKMRNLLNDMLETMYGYGRGGVGLAANQIGLTKRIIVVDAFWKGDPSTGKPMKMINPEYVDKSKEMMEGNEGCFSIPNQYAEVVRHAWVKVKYLDEYGRPQEVTADGLLSVVLQHEIDHLDGVMFIDYLSQMKRSILMKRFDKFKKKRAEEELYEKEHVKENM